MYAEDPVFQFRAFSFNGFSHLACNIQNCSEILLNEAFGGVSRRNGYIGGIECRESLW